MFQRRLAEPLARYERLYYALRKVFNCEVIVDSSKSPFYGYVLQLLEGIDPYVIHLTRDPRASAYSWLRRTAQRGGWLPKRHKSSLASSLTWNYRNGVVEVMGKSKRFRRPPLCLRYEDFVANPRKTLQRILSFVGATSSSLPLHDEHSLNLNIQHTVSGNPNRFKTGKIDIRADLAWTTEMKPRDRMLVTAATWPLLIKYGYASKPIHSVEQQRHEKLATDC
jgi:Sulfotransferase family